MNSKFARGMPTGFFSGPTGRDEHAVLTNRGTAPSGVTSITVRSDVTMLLLGGAEIDFGDRVITAADTVPLTAGVDATVPLLQPLTTPLANNQEAWHEVLHRITGTSNSDLSGDARLEDTTPALGSSLWREQTVTQLSWSLDRRGVFHHNDPGYLTVRNAWLAGRPVRVIRILPDANGDPASVQRGRALITNFRNPSPADGIIEASWLFTGTGPLELLDTAVIPVFYANHNY